MFDLLTPSGGPCKGKTFSSILLYDSFPLTWYATWLYFEKKKIFYTTHCVRSQGHNLNKLGNGPLGDATCKISRLKSLWFQTRRFYHVFFVYANVKHVIPGLAHFWPQGHNLNKLGKGPLGDATYQISRL